MAKEEIPVIATTITKTGLTILAETAACPKTKAPTILIVVPIGEGTRKPASLINSKEISKIKIFIFYKTLQFAIANWRKQS